jgi:Fis family transcriptional regulator
MQEKNNVVNMNFVTSENKGLSGLIKDMLNKYFQSQNGKIGSNLYELIIKEVEISILEVTMKQVGGNKSKAAEILGINRNTLHKKIQQYNINIE